MAIELSITTDFQNFLSGFTGSGNSWEVGDFNDDGAVDITDFADHFLPNMSTSYGPGQVVIPEPASLVLMGIAVVWCLAGISFGTERNPPR